MGKISNGRYTQFLFSHLSYLLLYGFGNSNFPPISIVADMGVVD